ncbi:MAG: GTPase HflX [Alphaproteobacteria bacterium]|nr:GTPase HflX [Alphaproteobacteria bacterium]
MNGHAPRSRTAESQLAEAVGLAQAIDLDVVHQETVRLARVVPALFLGKGVVERFRDLVKALEIDVVILDTTLSPVQQRNLETALKTKVIDRTGLILEIFGARARTHEGRLQVELAALTYQRSRLVRSWTHLERQRGGFGFMGGPGESQLEIDRRLIDQRIAHLKRELERVRRTRSLHRKARERVPYPVVALVGYTNAGKSTLFNRLCDSSVFAEDQLFATLDPTMRAVTLPSGHKIILSDTVGFVAELPTHLVAAFRATLEEVAAADIILHVRDIAHPETDAQRADVLAVLAEMGIGPDERPVEVLNKIDLLNEADRAVVLEQAERDPNAVALSAATGEGCSALLDHLGQQMSAGRDFCRYRLDLSDGAALAWLYAHGKVVERHDENGAALISVSMDPTDVARFEHRFGAKPILESREAVGNR